MLVLPFSDKKVSLPMSATLTFEIEPNANAVPAAEREERIAAPGFGKVFTDHMVTIRYTEGQGWHDAKVTARQPLVLDALAEADRIAAMTPTIVLQTDSGLLACAGNEP